MLSNLLQNYPLFKECIEALNAHLLSNEVANRISALFNTVFPLTEWGKIDWEKIDKKIYIGYEPASIIPALEKLLGNKVDKLVFIEWSTGGIPVIEAYLDAIIQHFDDVTCVAHQKFIFNLTQGYIIEVRLGGEITIGLIRPISI